METVRSACPLDCPDACTLEVKVEGGRVVTLDGGHANPSTEGYICAKVRAYPDHLYSSDRLLRPAIRRGRKGEGIFAPVSWNEALDTVARRLLEARTRHGGEAILPVSYGGSNGFFSQDTTDARLFRRLGASTFLRTVCAAPSRAAAAGLYGRMAGVTYEDYARANLIVLWGVNPSASGIHLVPYIQRAQKRGARIVVIDPRRTRLAERADLHLAVRPGSDLVVALAVINRLFGSGAADLGFLAAHATGLEKLRERAAPWTFERAAAAAEVPASDIERFASMYAEASPAVIRCGWGPERSRCGGSAIAAILALPAVAGKFGVRGGGYTMSNSGVWGIDSIVAAKEPEPDTRDINMNHLGRELLTRKDPPIDVLFVYNSNPLTTVPNQSEVRRGLEREDLFTVVFDHVMTDTARYADVVLPATTFLERHEMSRGYGAIVLQEARPAVPPLGEARSNHEVFAELCRRTGVARPGDPTTIEEIRSAILASHPRGEEIGRSLETSGVAFMEFGPSPIQFVDAFPRTTDRKVHFFPEDLDREAPRGLYVFQEDPASERFPLALISPATDRTVSSMFGQLHRDQVPLEIHPADASSRAIADGDTVRVHNGYGEVRCRARLSAAMRPGVVLLPKGIWSHNTLNGSTANAVSPDTLTDLGGGACFNDARVQVERIA